MKIFYKVAISFIFACANISPAFADGVKTLKPDKVFAYYDKFLKLPPDKKNAIKVDYYLINNGGNIKAFNLIYKNQRLKIPYDKSGKILFAPNLDQMQNGLIEIAAVGKGGITIDAKPNLPLNSHYEIAQINDALSDLNSTMSLAGALSLALPKLNSVKFVGTSSGVAILRDGRRIPISENKNGIIFNPALSKYRGAVAVELNKNPIGLEYEK